MNHADPRVYHVNPPMDKAALATATKCYRSLGSCLILLAIQDYRGEKPGSENYDSAANFLFPCTLRQHELMDWACSIIGIDSAVVKERLAGHRVTWDAKRGMVRNGWRCA